MLLLIDNYDSFTYNLYQYLAELGAEVLIYRNDAITLAEVESLAPSHIVISPGPGAPARAGVSNAVIEHFGPRIPTLGVCLGHQCIGVVFGGQVIRAPLPVHGKIAQIIHRQRDLFYGLPNPFEGARYHSLVVERASLPEALAITAETEDGLIMAIQHQAYPITGLQFHPESILTQHGKALLQNFLRAKRSVLR